jgi:hypothetical protein
MRHKGGREISPPALQQRDRHEENKNNIGSTDLSISIGSD